MDIYDEQECQASIFKINSLLNCGIFDIANSGNILQSAAFTELMVCLRDLLYKTEKYVKRVSFKDDIITNDYVHDITDAVTATRDACCHLNSFKQIFDEQGNRGSFIVIYGKGTFAKFGDVEVKSEYEDDTAVFYGKNRLYINRHIVRAFKEATTLLIPILTGRDINNGTITNCST
jgi:hypothetical protein